MDGVFLAVVGPSATIATSPGKSVMGPSRSVTTNPAGHLGLASVDRGAVHGSAGWWWIAIALLFLVLMLSFRRRSATTFAGTMPPDAFLDELAALTKQVEALQARLDALERRLPPVD